MVNVVGAGLGTINTMTMEAINKIKKGDIVLSTARISKEIENINNKIKILTLTEIIQYINNQTNENIVVIATGDVGFFSISTTLKNNVKDGITLNFINGISSMQYLCSKLLTKYTDIKMVSLHGNNKNIIPYVCYNERVFCVTGGKNTVRKIIDDLIYSGLTEVLVTVGERLSYDDETITTKKAIELKGKDFDILSVLLIENKDIKDIYEHINDDDFIRGKAPMTKSSIRNLSVELLGVKPNDIVYDVGAGTGSVTVCLARKAVESLVYAIEKNDDAYELIAKNIEKFKAYNIISIKGLAPLLDNDTILPPDKVFIGGSSGNLDSILSWVTSKNKDVTVVITALTLETLVNTTEFFKNKNIHYEVYCINASISQKLGRYTMMKGENPIYIIKGDFSETNKST